MDVRQLGALALVIVTAAIIIGIGSQILYGLQTQQCTGNSRTWIDNTTRPNLAVVATNPVTGAWYGCCNTITGTGNNCTIWTTDIAALNVTTQGSGGLVIFSQWIPLISLVVVASIVIGVIVRYMGGMGGV
jgi:hypothetical protein